MKFEHKKSLGQNSLKNQDIVNKIIERSDIDKDTLVIEIGPGSGMLSKEILRYAGFSILYEIDERLKPILEKELKLYTNYEIIFNDFLKEDINKTIVKYNYKKIYLIANLPYYITTPIIKKIIDNSLKIDKMIIMIQKEVANRFVAKPKSKEYGSITVFLNYYYYVNKLFDVSKSEFIPKPKVDSSVIELVKREEKRDLKNYDIFNKLIVDSFKYKRKNLKNNLINYDLNLIDSILKKYGLSINSRAEELKLDIFIEISNNIQK